MELTKYTKPGAKIKAPTVQSFTQVARKSKNLIIQVLTR